MPLVNKKEETKDKKQYGKKCAQMLMYYVTTTTTYLNMDMGAILGPTNFELGATYNIVLSAQLHDVAAIAAVQTANRFLLSSSAMRFKNTETAVGKQASPGQFVSYASFPMFYGGAAVCNVKSFNNSCVQTFILESQQANITVQMQSLVNNTIDNATVYPNYLLIFDIYKCD